MIRCTLLTFCVFWLNTAVFGQQNLTLYGMKELPQSFYLNPGFKQKNRFYLSLPLGYNTVSFNHSGFKLASAYVVGNDDSLVIRPDLAIAKMGKRNLITFDLNNELFGFAFKVKRKNYISFSTSLRENFTFSYPKDLFRFVNEGNGSEAFLGKRASLDGLGVYNNAYIEYALGYNRDISKKLAVGGRVKLISGLANIHTSSSKLGITTNAETFDITIDGQMGVNSSNALYFLDSAGQDALMTTFPKAAYNFSNFGLGFDFGGSYKLTDKIELNASLLDLGFINWKTNIKNYESSSVNYTFKGVDVNAVLFDSLDLGNHLADTLSQVFGYQANNEGYRTSLATRFYIGGVYNLNKTFSSSLTLYNQFIASRYRMGAAVAMNMHVRNWLSFAVNYSAYGRSMNNIGVGLRLKGGPLQFYIATDNILVGYNPAKAKNAHLTFGLNLMIGPMKDKDDDGVKNRKDDCPELAGLEKFNGCPDADNDSIIDTEDACPQVFGLKSLKGCPDKDGDKVTDGEDQCPEIAGLIEFKGCPDTDNDSIIDQNDSCPEIKGLRFFNGCPDTDGDGIKDDEDACPLESGPILNQGCPDSDGDGLINGLDNCPTQAGPKENNGCPWPDSDSDGLLDKDDKCPYLSGPIENQGCPYQDTDNDGLLDSEDACPNTVGPVENKGCPVIEKEVEEILQTAFDNLEFASGKDVILASSYQSLDKLAEVLQKKSEWGLQVSGHTDNQGDAQQNLILSKKRAEAIRTYMVAKGIDASRFTILYFGETMPIATNDTQEGRQKNRRVEMKIFFQ